MNSALKRRHQMVGRALQQAGFESPSSQEWIRAVTPGVRQTIELSDNIREDWHSFQIGAGVLHEQVAAFVANCLDEEPSDVATAGGQLSRLISRQEPDGWVLHSSERMDNNFEGIVQQLVEVGLPALDEVSSWEGLVRHAGNELQSPGSSWLRMNHAFELPAVLFLAKRYEDVASTIKKVLDAAPRSESGEVLPFERRDRYFQCMRQMMRGES